MSNAVPTTVTIKVTDKNGSWTIVNEPVADVKAYIEHVEHVVVQQSSYCGPVSIFFGVDFGNEYDGFTRFYNERQYLYTV